MMSMSSYVINAITVHTRCGTRVVDSSACFVAALVVDVFDVEGVDVAGEITKNCEQNVNEEICSASSDEENSHWREKDCYDDEEDCGNHFVDFVVNFVLECWDMSCFLLNSFF